MTTENPITGPSRYTLEDRHTPAIPKSSIEAAIQALGLGDDMRDICGITMNPAEVTVEYYERDENGALTTRRHRHGLAVNSHTITLDIDNER